MPISRRGALAALAAAVALPVLAAPGAAADLTLVRVAGAPDDDITPVLYGISSGIFAKAGLDVRLQALSSGSATAAAVAGGAVDIGKSSTLSLVAAHARGLPFVLIAPASVYRDTNPNAGLVVAKDSGIKTGRDLAGKTLGASALRDMMGVSAQAWIDQNGGDSKDVKIVEIPSSGVVAALQQHRIDAATMVTPALASALDSGAVLIGRPFSAIAKRFLASAWFTTSDWIARNPETARRWLAAYLQCTAYTDTHHDQTVDLLSSYSHLASETIRTMVRMTAGRVVEPSDVAPVIAAAVKYGVIEKPFPASEMIAAIAPR